MTDCTCVLLISGGIEKLGRIPAFGQRLSGLQHQRADVDARRAAVDVERGQRFAGRSEPLVFERLERERDHLTAEEILIGDRQKKDQRARILRLLARRAQLLEQLGADRRLARFVRVRRNPTDGVASCWFAMRTTASKKRPKSSICSASLRAKSNVHALFAISESLGTARVPPRVCCSSFSSRDRLRLQFVDA